MTKREKVQLLIQYTNVQSQIEADFKKKVNMLELPHPPEQAEVIRQAILARFYSRFAAFLESQIDSYDKFLSDPAVDASIAFYTSDVGEEIIRQMPKIYEEIDKYRFTMSKAMFQDMMNILDEYHDDKYEDSDED